MLKSSARIWLAAAVVAIAVSSTSGCSGARRWDPFACLDYCYLADWTNHYSCLSCCTHPDGGDSAPLAVEHDCPQCR